MLRASHLAFAAFAVLAIPAFAASRAMQMLDTNNDGAIDIEEADAAAAAMFDWLAQHKVGSLTKDEYLALVAKWFKAADQDGDGKLDEDELRLPAGRKLQRLLRQ